MTDIWPLEPLQPASGGPLYLQLKAAIEAAITTGRLRPGQALPAEREIAETAHVSRVTVRKAMDTLVKEGALIRRQGSGTFVAQPVPRMQQPLTWLTSFSEDMRRRGMEPGSRWLERGLFSPSSDETMVLGLTAGMRVARLTRLRTADGMPIALECASLPADILPTPEAVEHSLYQSLTARGFRPVRANQRISAAVLKDEETRLLGVAPGSAALCIQRVAYLETGRAMELTRTLYRGDAYDLVAELAIRP